MKKNEETFPYLTLSPPPVLLSSPSNLFQHGQHPEIRFDGIGFRRSGHTLHGVTTQWLGELISPWYWKNKKHSIPIPCVTHGIPLQTIDMNSIVSKKRKTKKKTLSMNMKKGIERGIQLEQDIQFIYPLLHSYGVPSSCLTYTYIQQTTYKKKEASSIVPSYPKSDEIYQFFSYHKKYMPHIFLLMQKLEELHLDIIGLQIMCFYHHILGSAIDMICQHRTTMKYHLIEIKSGNDSSWFHCSLNEEKDNRIGMMNSPFQNIPDCSYYRYSLQLLLYEQLYKHTFPENKDKLGESYLLRVDYTNCYHYLLPTQFFTPEKVNTFLRQITQRAH